MELIVQFLCATLFLTISMKGVQAEWPDGTYGLPMSKEGCPESRDFTWAEGSRLQETKSGSHASDPVHLAAIDTEESKTILQKFRIKRTFSTDKDGDDKFMPGSYCLFKKGDCPDGFNCGYIYWDDAASRFGLTKQSASGVTPDGTYDRNTRIKYCCRGDALPTKAIKLPTSAPFYLLQFTEYCQKVEGMECQEEWVYWAGEDLVTSFGNSGGTHPNVRSLKTIVMTTIYVVLAVVGLILLVWLLMCIVQGILYWHSKRKEYNTNNTENLAREAMVTEVQRADTPTPSSSSGTTAGPTPTKKVALRHDGSQIVELHCYSTVPEAAPPVEVLKDDEPYTVVLPGRDTLTQPPSYDEVLREDAQNVKTPVVTS